MGIINSTLNKLKMIGLSIQAYNDFGIITKDDDGIVLFVLDENDTLRRIEYSKLVYTFRLSPYFIVIRERTSEKLVGLYVAGSAKNIIEGLNISRITTDVNMFIVQQDIVSQMESRVVYLTDNDDWNKYLVNHKGKLLDISDILNIHGLFFIKRDIEGNNNMRLMSTFGEDENTYLEFDDELENMRVIHGQ